MELIMSMSLCASGVFNCPGECFSVVLSRADIIVVPGGVDERQFPFWNHIAVYHIFHIVYIPVISQIVYAGIVNESLTIFIRYFHDFVSSFIYQVE